MFQKKLFSTMLASTLFLSSANGITLAHSQVGNSSSTEQITTTVAQTDLLSYEEMYKSFNLNELFFDPKDYSVTAVSTTQFTLKISVDAVIKSYEDGFNVYDEGKAEFLANIDEIRAIFGNSIEMRFTKQSKGIKKEFKVGKVWTQLSAEDEAIFVDVLGRGNELERAGGYFVDTLNHWAEAYIQFLYELDIVNGQTSVNFNPNGNITRAQLAAMIFRTVGFSVSEEFETYAPYQDIRNHQFAKEISVLYDYGMLEIFDEGNFNPNKPATREEVAAITYALLSVYGVGLDAGYNLYFKDVNSMDPLAMEAIAFLQQEGIITGFKDGTFKPKQNITRAQFAKILTLTTFALEAYYVE